MESEKMSDKEKHLLVQWQECGKWLHRIGFIRDDHKLNCSSCTVPDFALFFRDGVTLCKLLYFLDSSSIDMSAVSLRPHNAQSLCKRNIKRFLTCCSKHFKLREFDLFTPEQLFEFTDFGKVLECLSKLSLCSKVLESNIEGFHLAAHPADAEEEDVYRSLQDMANHNPGFHQHRLSSNGNGNSPAFGISRVGSARAAGSAAASAVAPAAAQACAVNGDCSLLRRDLHDDCGLRTLQKSMRGSTGPVTSRKRDDEVYQSLCYVTFKLQQQHSLEDDQHRYDEVCLPIALDVCSGDQELVYSSILYHMQPEDDGSRDKRECCLQELLETEKGYVKALSNIIKMFLRPLQEMLTSEQIDVIFFRLRSLTEVHQSLLMALTEALAHSGRHSSVQLEAVAQVFVRFQCQLLVYGEYCAHYQTALALLDDVTSTRPNVRDIVKASEAAMSAEKHQLRDLLFVPVQRVLKYPLLLHELLRCSGKGDSECNALQMAYDCMVDVAEYANEYKRDRETVKILEDVQASITDLPAGLTDLKELGRMRLDGEIRIECHPEKNKLRFVFLFDKALIMCKQSKMPEMLRGDEKYLYKDSVSLEGCKVDVGGAGIWSGTLGASGSVDSSNGGLFGGGTGGGVGRKGGSNSFLLVVRDNKKAYTIITKNEMEKEKWLHAVTSAIEAVNPSENLDSEHKFVLTTFSDASVRCMSCSKLMKGTIYQGYTCRHCQVQCHRDCLQKVCDQAPCQPGACAAGRPASLQLSAPLTAVAVPVAGVGVNKGEWSEFWAADMRSLPWWAECMSRERAEEALLPTQQGTFLMRWSDKHSQPVVSLKVSTEVKHMRIHQEVNDARLQFYFCKARNFLTLGELVNYYHLYPLSEAFQELEERLRRPIYDSAVSLFEFTGCPTSATSSTITNNNNNYLPLQPGLRVVVLGRQGQDRGWWNGRSEFKVGFFPREFVKVDEPPIICL